MIYSYLILKQNYRLLLSNEINEFILFSTINL